MAISAVHRMSAQGRELDISPEAFGQLRTSDHLRHDAPALRDRLAQDGYLYLPGYLDPDEVRTARHDIPRRLAAVGRVAPDTDPKEAIPGPERTRITTRRRERRKERAGLHGALDRPGPPTCRNVDPLAGCRLSSSKRGLIC